MVSMDNNRIMPIVVLLVLLAAGTAVILATY
jgi:hypothetical protein